MKTLFPTFVAAAALFAGAGVAVAQPNPAQNPPAQTPGATRTHQWWRDRPAGGFPYRTNAKKLPLISVKGNHFEDPDGKTVVFRGLAISDPDKLEMQGHWSKDHFAKVKEMGATIVRIPVHPVAWRERTPAQYFKLLDQAVEWCTDLGMYVDLDWHSIGNLTTGLFQDPMYDTSQQETYNFWRDVARHYPGHNTIAFFELFNEPTTYREQLGPINWMAWKRMVEEQIAVIRAYNPQVIPLVAGFDWAYDLTPLRIAPIDAPGIGYVTHPYDNKRPQPWPPKWEEDFGFAAATYPVVATEFGGFQAPGATAPPTATGRVLDSYAYGPEIFGYLEKKGISWMVWCFDPEWGPSLIKDWNYTLTPAGQYAKEAMKGPAK
jgi:aryl-phospho-beta-D-glucosidase BglC (GH1 family)